MYVHPGAHGLTELDLTPLPLATRFGEILLGISTVRPLFGAVLSSESEAPQKKSGVPLS